MNDATLDELQASEANLNRIALLRDEIAPIRKLVINHRLYSDIRTIADLHVFLESHVYAVWDFMSLLKALQRELTCVTLPWLPGPFPECRRMVNEIVLAEESDEFEGLHLSHFELYCRAMREAGANTIPIERFLNELRNAIDIRDALVMAGAADGVKGFLESTFRVIREGKPHVIAAAFTFGREDLIPDMFRCVVMDLDRRFPGRLSTLVCYLERHIDLDGETHGPMAMQMVSDLCEGDEQRWNEATQAAIDALEARLTLWTTIRNRIASTTRTGPSTNGSQEFT